MAMKYLDRLIDKSLEEALNSIGCVYVMGPKFCGKSTSCRRFASSVTELKNKNQIELASSDPLSALRGTSPHLIDEWQKVPLLWDLIRDDLDKDYVFGKYIITGSTTPSSLRGNEHSGAGRIASLVMRPLSLFESKESSGAVSLSKLFDDSNVDTIPWDKNPLSLSELARLMCRGGWPISIYAKKEYQVKTTSMYYDGLFNITNGNDEYSTFLKSKDIDLLKLILKEFARNISTQTRKTKMIDEILRSGARKCLDDDTFLSYKKILENLFIIYDTPAWNMNLRTSVSVGTSPTYHFFDTSIALACLGATPASLLLDLNSMGLFFEDFVYRDLSVYASTFDAKIHHYRDSGGQEVDAIVSKENGDYGAIEIKLYSEENVNAAVSSLNRFEAKAIKNGNKPPLFKMVLTSHGPSYKRSEDNVVVVPINFLRD